MQMWYGAPPVAGPLTTPFGAPGPYNNAWPINPYGLATQAPPPTEYMAPVWDATAFYENDI